jgi:signal transduction histidine kinase
MALGRTPESIAGVAAVAALAAAAVAIVATAPSTLACLAAVGLAATGIGSTWLSVRAVLRALPDEIQRLTHDLEMSAPGGRPAPRRTSNPQAAGVIVDVDSFLRALDRALSRHRLARIEAEYEDRSETEFLTDLSHELRTPLNAILGFASVLAEEIDGPLEPSQREDVETILASGKHLGALVDDVLDMAALHSGRVTLTKSEVDVGALVRDVVRLLEAQRRKKPIAIRADVPIGLPRLRADEKRLRQIAMNLGTNALKFTERGEVVLVAVEEGDGIRITVRDTGPGIPPGERDSIFLEFMQTSSGVMRRTQGSGLGLAIVRRLTELHGGRIWLDSVSGEGSAFHVWLPFEAAS